MGHVRHAQGRPTADDLRLLEGGEDWVNKYDVDDDWDCARAADRQTSLTDLEILPMRATCLATHNSICLLPSLPSSPRFYLATSSSLTLFMSLQRVS